jgi:endonuclease YncB( thermonuclease family)
VTKLHDKKTKRPGLSFYILVGMLGFSAWQYYSVGAITWPTLAASKIESLVRRGSTQARLALPGNDIQWADGAAARGAAPSAAAPERSIREGPGERPSFLSRARVTRVVDGDSVELDMDGKTVRARLLCMDAPELGQAFGSAARRHLEGLIGRRDVLVENEGTDRYDRLLTKLYPTDGDTSLNWQMVRDGYAWDNARFPCGGAYRRAEESARETGVGLWRERNAIPPWDWREANPRGSG